MAKSDKKRLFKLMQEAAKSLPDMHDKELAERLAISMEATEQEQWNRKLIATLLAKAGKTKDAESFALAAEVHWVRAETLLSMAQALWSDDDKKTALAFMHSAAEQADEGQDAVQGHDQLDACSVLGEIAIAYAEIGELAEARKLIAKITDLTRKARAAERLHEIAPKAAELAPKTRTKAKSATASRRRKSGRKR